MALGCSMRFSIFRMTTFFFIAGYFAHLSLHKRGLRPFIRDRLKRIGLPLLVGWLILMPVFVAVTIWGALVMAHGKKLPPPPPYHFPAFPWTHLWFLYVLLLLYAAVLILRGLVVGLDRFGVLRRANDACVRVLATSGLLVVVLGTPAALALYLMPSWLMWFGIPTPDSSLVPNLSAAVGFGTAFALGWLVHRTDGALGGLEAPLAAQYCPGDRLHSGCDFIDGDSAGSDARVT